MDQKKTMDSIISKEIYRLDMDQQNCLNLSALQDAQRERELKHSKMDADKKKLEDYLNRLNLELKKITTARTQTPEASRYV